MTDAEDVLLGFILTVSDIDKFADKYGRSRTDTAAEYLSRKSDPDPAPWQAREDAVLLNPEILDGDGSELLAFDEDDSDPIDRDRTAEVLAEGSVWANDNTDLDVDHVLPRDDLPGVSMCHSVEIRVNREGTGFEGGAIFESVDMIEFACDVHGWDREDEDEDTEVQLDEDGEPIVHELPPNERKAVAWLEENNAAIAEFWAERGIEDDNAMQHGEGRLTVRAPLDDRDVTFAGAAQALRDNPTLDYVFQGLNTRDAQMTKDLIAKISASQK